MTNDDDAIQNIAMRVDALFSDCLRAEWDDLNRLEAAGLLTARKATKYDSEESSGEIEKGETIFEWTEGGRALLEQFRWKPIETAPRDGTHILAFPVLSEVACVVSWEPEIKATLVMQARGEKGREGYWRLPMTSQKSPYNPTHWMSLLKPNT